MFVGYLKGVKIITGEIYLFRGRKVILKEVHRTVNLYGYKNTEYWFQYYDSCILFKVLEEELVKADFRKWLEWGEKTDFINNDMVDSLRYSLECNKSFYDTYILGKLAEKVATNIDETLLKQHKLPRKVIFNDKKKATTILYGDEATVVKACKGDEYDREKGFLMAFFQKQTGLSKTQAKKYLKSITEEKE